jgi:cytochrome c
MRASITLAAVFAAAVALSGTARADDVAAGKAIFDRTCANCHEIKIGVNKIGPTLWNIAGRPVASVPDFSYSDTLKSMKTEWGTWDDKNLNAYLENPRGVLHGVKMFFKGLPEAKDRAAVIAYLATLK